MRRRRPPDLTGPAAQLAAHADAMRAAVAAGDPRAAERLAAAESFAAMLADSGNDPDIGQLLTAFAAEDA